MLTEVTQDQAFQGCPVEKWIQTTVIIDSANAHGIPILLWFSPAFSSRARSHP